MPGLRELCTLLWKEELQDFTLILRRCASGISVQFRDHLMWKKAERRLIWKIKKHRERFGWTLAVDFEWRGGVEIKPVLQVPDAGGILRHQLSKDPSVVAADGEMIWQFDEEVRL